MRGKTTRRLASTYYQQMSLRICKWKTFRFTPLLDYMTEKQKHDFRLAAHQCSSLGADLCDYVSAQFNVFDRVSDKRNRIILPMPHHMHGPNAKRRWEKFAAGDRYLRDEGDIVSAAKRVAGSDGHVFDVEAVHDQFFREDRKLASLAAMLKVSPEAVLQKHKTQFSPEFLAMRGVRLAA